MPANEYVVRTKDLFKEFTMGDSVLQALSGVQLDIFRGEYISIMGPSGSGKTTLFNMVGGLDKPSAGAVYIDDVDMAQLDAYELAWLRCRKIAVLLRRQDIKSVGDHAERRLFCRLSLLVH